MIDASQVLRLSPFLEADQRAFVGTSVYKRMQFAVLIAGHNDRHVADGRRLVVTWRRHIDIEAQIVPDRPPKDALLFERIDLFIRKQAKGNAGNAFRRPLKRLAQLG